MNLKAINIVYACFKRLKTGSQKCSFDNLICKAYLRTVRPVFFYLLSPVPSENRVDLVLNVGMRVLLNTLTSQQLSIVWHAKLLLSIINFSKRVFVSVIQKLLESLV